MLNYLKSLMLILVASLAFVSCSDDDNTTEPTDETIKIAVFSDPHLYDPSLGTTGSAFEAYVGQDRKLIAQSDAVLQKVVSNLLAEKPDIVLVPGDLTKDGEKHNHEKFAGYLRQLKNAGIKVLVVPGNHDINNPQSHSYSGDTPTAIPTVTPAEFKSIYADFGYGSAKEFAPNSLSYLAEPIEGLWILGIDATKHDNNVGHSTTSGEIKSTDLSWIKTKLAEAKSKNKKVLAMMHHGAIEHYTGQSQYFGEYVIDNWSTITPQLADAGLKVVFTGHFHAQDIVSHKTGAGNTIFDIETGSLVTYPCPYRMIELTTDNKLKVKSFRTEGVSYNIGSHPNFQSYAKAYLEDGLDELIIYMMMGQFGMTYEQAKAYGTQINPLMIPAVVSHYEGDEKPTAEQLAAIQQMMMSSDITVKTFGMLLGTYWTDLNPSDNEVIINLTTGVIE